MKRVSFFRLQISSKGLQFFQETPHLKRCLSFPSLSACLPDVLPDFHEEDVGFLGLRKLLPKKRLASSGPVLWGVPSRCRPSRVGSSIPPWHVWMEPADANSDQDVLEVGVTHDKCFNIPSACYVGHEYTVTVAGKWGLGCDMYFPWPYTFHGSFTVTEYRGSWINRICIPAKWRPWIGRRYYEGCFSEAFYDLER